MPCMCVGHAVLEFAGWSCVPSHRRTLRRCWHRCNADSQEASCSSGPPARFPTFYRARGRVPMALGSRGQNKQRSMGSPLAAHHCPNAKTTGPRAPTHGPPWRALENSTSRPPCAPSMGSRGSRGWRIAKRSFLPRQAPWATVFTCGPWWTASVDPVDRCFLHVDRGGPQIGIPWTVVFSHVDRGGP